MGKGQSEGDGEKLNLFRRDCSSEAVFIDAWCHGVDENKIPEGDLLPGEIEAVTFQVGCYTVRSALRIYTIQDSDWYLTDVGEPADKENVEMVREDLMVGKGDGKVTGAKSSFFASWGNIYAHAGFIPSWRDKLQITHEISAKHNSKRGKSFTYICRAAGSMNGKWFEYIGDIYVVKERDSVPDESASLLIYFVCTSGFYGVDTWYRFDPEGKITTFVSNLIDLDRF